MKKKVVLLIFMFTIFYGITALATNKPLNIQTKKVIENNTNVNINVDIPTVQSNNGIIGGVFSKIENQMEEFINGINKQAQNDLMGIKFEGASKYNIYCNDGNFISIVSNNYFYAGGAHGMSTLVPYNYDLKTGNKLELSDMFVKGFDYQKFINAKIKSDIEKNKADYFNNGADFKGIKENQDFYFSKEGLTIIFQLYEIAPYAGGFKYFDIPMQSIKENIKYQIN
ncbi:MAG: DUF3298 domain-containing protein [Sarcina sp.]